MIASNLYVGLHKTSRVVHVLPHTAKSDNASKEALGTNLANVIGCACVRLKSLGRRFQVCFAKYNMASTTGSGHGGRRENSGRKRKFVDGREAIKEWQRCHRRIYLEKNIFQSWLQAKLILGYEARSDSAFAAYLLSQELRRT